MQKKIRLGNLQKQPEGYKAFVPLPFPPDEPLHISSSLQLKSSEAMHLLGKLDGVTQLLPDKDFFLFMFVRKEATSSSQIEGTRATIVDAIKSEIANQSNLPEDVSDIIQYIKALNFGLKRFEKVPLSIRLITEVHGELLKEGRSTHHAYPGEIRRTQNWIHGTSLSNAQFIPPPPHEIPRAISDLEKFIHSKEDFYPPLIKAALLHAQFETIHPFVDGNGRTGRLLITLYLWHKGLLEIPILYLSDFFKRNQDLYFKFLNGYHSDPAEIEAWIEFFLDGIIETSLSAIKLSRKIVQIREEDMEKIQKLGKRAATSGVEILRHLFQLPIVDVSKIQEWTGFNSRAGAQKVLDRFVELGILTQKDPSETYARTYVYQKYLSLFYLN